MKKAFTLTELLLALTIVGVLAVLTVPILMNNIHNRMFATQVKNMSATIEQLAQDQLVTHRTRDLSDTDFADPAKLLSDKHFSIAKTCATSTDAKKNCWKITAEGKDKIAYKYIKDTGSANPVIGYTVVLKNGVLLTSPSLQSEENVSGDIVARITIDVNGNDKPNIAGRDLFSFYMTNKGHVVDFLYAKNVTMSPDEKKRKCVKGSGRTCYGALADNGWKMDY